MVNTISSAASTTPTAANSANQSSALSSDFETFLQMLTAQMQNQDPLNPVESTDFAVQLATFSEVEQAVLTNTLLEDLSTQLGLMGFSELSGWVGKEARTSEGAYFDSETPISMTTEFSSAADNAVLIVRDSFGVVRQEIAIDSTEDSFVWTGADASGVKLSSGFYSFEVENYSGDTYLSTTSVDTYARIIEARADDGDTVLVLEGGHEIGSEDVTALRDPE